MLNVPQSIYDLSVELGVLSTSITFCSCLHFKKSTISMDNNELKLRVGKNHADVLVRPLSPYKAK